MTESAVAVRPPTPYLVKSLDVTAKGVLLLLLVIAVRHPDVGNMEGKAGGIRAVGYPILALVIPVIWWQVWRDWAAFPWLADLLLTITCFSDVSGNRMDLYDTVVWFDDLMHFMNTGLLAAAVILLTMPRGSGFASILERALAFGVTAAVAWEIAEYFAFLNGSSDRANAYSDTLGDLGVGALGAVTAAFVIHRAWQSGALDLPAPTRPG